MIIQKIAGYWHVGWRNMVSPEAFKDVTYAIGYMFNYVKEKEKENGSNN